MTMYVFTLFAIAMLAVAAVVRIRIVKNQRRMRAALARAAVLLVVVGVGSIAVAQPGQEVPFDEQLLARYTDLGALMAVAPVEDAIVAEDEIVADDVAAAIAEIEQPTVESYDILDGQNFCSGAHAVFASLTAEEIARPDWLDQPLFNKGSGEHWVAVSSGPWLTEIEAATALDEAVYKAVAEYVDDQIGRRGASARIGLSMREVHQQHLIVEQYNEEREFSVGPMHVQHVKLVFTPQFRAEVGERWKQHLITARLLKTSIGIGAVMGLMFIAFGVLKRRNNSVLYIR